MTSDLRVAVGGERCPLVVDGGKLFRGERMRSVMFSIKRETGLGGGPPIKWGGR